MFISHPNRIKVSVTTQTFDGKPAEGIGRLLFREREMDVIEFPDLIAKGHAFCATFAHDGDDFAIKHKTTANFTGTYCMVFDMDCVRTDVKTFSDIMFASDIPPTFVYPTPSDGKIKKNQKGDFTNNYRVVYCMTTPIIDIDTYKEVSAHLKNEIASLIGDDTIHNDDSDLSPVQFFWGNKGARIYLRPDALRRLTVDSYTAEELCERYGVTQPEYTFVNGRAVRLIDTRKKGSLRSNKILTPLHTTHDIAIGNGVTNEMSLSVDERFTSDFWCRTYGTLLSRYAAYYPVVERTPVHFDKDCLFALTPADYRVIRRRFLIGEQVVTTDGRTAKNMVSVRIRNGNRRRRHLFTICMLHRAITPDITFENLLYVACNEMYRYIDNTDKDDIITKKTVWGIVKDAMRAPVKLRDDQRRPNYIINPDRAAELGMTKRAAVLSIENERRRRVKEALDTQIMRLYDPALTVKQNLAALTNAGVNVSLSKLYRWRKENGLVPEIKGSLRSNQILTPSPIAMSCVVCNGVTNEMTLSDNIEKRIEAWETPTDQQAQTAAATFARQQRKVARDTLIAQYYDPSLTDAQNLQLLRNNGIDIRLKTFKRWKKANGHTRRHQHINNINNNTTMTYTIDTEPLFVEEATENYDVTSRHGLTSERVCEQYINDIAAFTGCTPRDYVGWFDGHRFHCRHIGDFNNVMGKFCATTTH